MVLVFYVVSVHFFNSFLKVYVKFSFRDSLNFMLLLLSLLQQLLSFSLFICDLLPPTNFLDQFSVHSFLCSPQHHIPLESKGKCVMSMSIWFFELRVVEITDWVTDRSIRRRGPWLRFTAPRNVQPLTYLKMDLNHYFN